MTRALTPRARKSGKCPVCGKPETPDQRPFCSQGCRDRDLLQWLGEGYKMPGPAAPMTDEDGER